MFEELISLLKNIKFEKTQKQRRQTIGSIGDVLLFGYGNVKFKGIGEYVANCRYKNVWEYLKLFCKKNLPPYFEWNCIYITKNMKAKKHKDKQNVGDSYFVCFGDFNSDDGGLLIYDEYEEDKCIYTVKKNELYRFNGYKHYHETEDYSGERYSMIIYKNIYYNNYLNII